MAMKGVRSTHPEYDEHAPLWERCDDVAAGTEALRRKTTKYLPKLTDETPEEYDARLGRTTLYNATWRTIVGFLGLLFRKPAVIDVPEAVRPLMDDITLTGVPLRLFAAEVSEELLVTGRLGIWVNFPDVAAGLTRADVANLGLRPSMTLYCAESIRNWRCDRVQNRTMLSQVVLEEEHEVRDTEFDTKHVDRYRVLDLTYDPGFDRPVYRVRLFEVKRNPDTGTEEDVLVEGPFYPMMDGEYLDFIPFYFISPDDTTPDVDIPPFIDLVDVNLSHYRATADYEHGCHWSGIPTVVITGHTLGEGESIRVGGAGALVFPDPAANAQMLEVGTGGFTALEKNLDRKEAQMVVLGARLLEVQKPGIEAAETALIHRSGEQSILASISQTISTGITEALKVFVKWAGADGNAAAFMLNRDFFHTPLPAEMLNAIVKSWQSGAISFETMFDNLKKGEVYLPDAKAEDEKQRIEEGRSMLPQPKPVAGQGTPSAPALN